MVTDMVFYVYMSPDVIQDAHDGGSSTTQLLAAVLQGFVQNCFIVEFEDYRVQKEILRNVRMLPDNDAKKKIMTLLGKLKKSKHFICCLVPDYSIESINISLVNDQADNAFLDFILVSEKEILQIKRKAEVDTLNNYFQTRFESERFNLASYGILCQEGELDENEFLDKYFKKAFIHTRKVEIYDRIFGSRFNDNFAHTFKTLFKWLENNLVDPKSFEGIIIHGEMGYDCNDSYLKYITNSLSDIKKRKFENIFIELRLYSESMPGQSGCSLGHPRFIVTDQVAFNIERGMDFLNREYRRNRQTILNLLDSESVRDMLRKLKTPDTLIRI